VSAPVAAVVVTWNSASEIDNCLRSLENIGEIVVVDNGSTDETLRVIAGGRKGVGVIANPQNRGFAAAANQGVKATTSPLLLFLNPDAALLNSLEPLVSELQAPGVGAAGGRLEDLDGRVQAGFNVRAFPTPASLACEVLLVNRLWPSNPVNRRYRRLDLDHGRAQDVDQPAGAFLMVRREVLEAVGGWDERFCPLWFEDVDLCLRIRQAGYRIRYVPAAAARHRGGHSLARISVQDKEVYWYRSLLRYTEKHYPSRARVLLRAAVFLGALLRSLASLGRGEAVRAYSKVMGLALRRRAMEIQVQPNALS